MLYKKVWHKSVMAQSTTSSVSNFGVYEFYLLSKLVVALIGISGGVSGTYLFVRWSTFCVSYIEDLVVIST